MQEDTALGEQPEPGLQEANVVRSCPLLMFPSKVTRNDYRPSFFKLFRCVMQHYIHCISCVSAGPRREDSFFWMQNILSKKGGKLCLVRHTLLGKIV